MNARRVFVFLWALVLLGRIAPAQEFSPPRVAQYVTDLTATLTPGELAALNAKLEQFDRESSTQIVVLMVPTIGDLPIEEATLKVAELNKVGKKGKDNGALLFIAKDDRKLRIEVGYGLEGALPDILAGQIIRKEIGPRFREGDYYGGITAGVQSIMLATKNEYKADPRERRTVSNIIPFLVILFVVFMILSSIFRRRGPPGGTGIGRRSGGGPVFFPPIGGGWGGRSGGFGGGGGFGGFGGGGFSGGGGSFGGGGASGSW